MPSAKVQGDLASWGLECLLVVSHLSSQLHLRVLQDDPDNRILECALIAQADMVVTGDRHLLSLKRYERISIVKLSDFLALLR